jgi:hypothetical protein
VNILIYQRMKEMRVKINAAEEELVTLGEQFEQLVTDAYNSGMDDAREIARIAAHAEANMKK